MKCSICKTDKPEDQFYKSCKSWCKSCFKDYYRTPKQKAYRNAHNAKERQKPGYKEQFNSYQEGWRKTETGKRSAVTTAIRTKNKKWQIKRDLVDLLGGKCSSCGYSKCIEALDFHHLDPSQKDGIISQMIWKSGYSSGLANVIEEAKKCVLLCKNCHTDLHHEEKKLSTSRPISTS